MAVETKTIKMKEGPVTKTRPEYMAVRKAQKNIKISKQPRLKIKLVYLMAGCIALIFLIWINIQVNNVSVQVTELEERMNNQESLNQYEKMEINRLSSFDIIYPIANEKHGMDYPPTEHKILVVPENLIKRD
ncbi:MAG: hypothetical protein GY863_16055 [bacterium]|nr:hypothetical protein [bacterium]